MHTVKLSFITALSSTFELTSSSVLAVNVTALKSSTLNLLLFIIAFYQTMKSY